jgi:hypothetical protein
MSRLQREPSDQKNASAQGESLCGPTAHQVYPQEKPRLVEPQLLPDELFWVELDDEKTDTARSRRGLSHLGQRNSAVLVELKTNLSKR